MSQKSPPSEQPSVQVPALTCTYTTPPTPEDLCRAFAKLAEGMGFTVVHTVQEDKTCTVSIHTARPRWKV